MFNQDDNQLMLGPYCNFVWVFSVYTCSSFLSSFPQTLDGSQCKKLQEIVLNIMSGDLPTYVASFGNSDVNSVGDWVKILNSKPANEVNKCRVFDAESYFLLSKWVNDFCKVTFTLQYIIFNRGRFIPVHRMLHGSAEGRGLDSWSRTNA